MPESFNAGNAPELLSLIGRELDTYGIGGIRKSDPEIFQRAIGDEPEGLKLRRAAGGPLFAIQIMASPGNLRGSPRS